MTKSNILEAALFTRGIAQPGASPENPFFGVSSPFIEAEKVGLNETPRLSLAKCLWSLIGLLNSYLMVSSVVGFYSLRVFEGLTPRKDDTTMTTVKMGCKDRVCAKAGERMLKLLQRC